MHRGSQLQDLNRWLAAVLIASGLGVSACTPSSEEEATFHDPVKVEPLEGTNRNRLIVEADAAERLGIETASVRDSQNAPSGAKRRVIPFAAVFYTPNGDTWAYTSPESLTFLRHRISVDHIRGKRAILSDGPPSGTRVVTVGVSELWGMETGLGH